MFKKLNAGDNPVEPEFCLDLCWDWNICGLDICGVDNSCGIDL
ncbi:hypothetical protein [Thermococcus celericrescens]|nr:hypothetical protein [Thermococcus celericrescens]